MKRLVLVFGLVTMLVTTALASTVMAAGNGSIMPPVRSEVLGRLYWN